MGFTAFHSCHKRILFGEFQNQQCTIIISILIQSTRLPFYLMCNYLENDSSSLKTNITKSLKDNIIPIFSTSIQRLINNKFRNLNCYISFIIKSSENFIETPKPTRGLIDISTIHPLELENLSFMALLIQQPLTRSNIRIDLYDE